MAMRNREQDDGMITKVVSINRVSKTVKGGRVMKFAALIVVGDGKGNIGYGVGKSGEVPEAIRKGEGAAKKNMHKVAMKGTTIPHEIVGVFGAGRVLMRPAAPGTGVLAGGPVRAVLEAAGRITETKAQVAEWRVDWYEDASDFSKIKETLEEMRDVLGEMPLLFTFRTLKEGGEKQINSEDYIKLNQNAAETGLIDLLDAELFTGDEAVKKIIDTAHRYGVRTVVSSHDFEKTPPREEIVFRLRKMQELGADIPKIAVMPRNRKDVLTLLAATEEMFSNYADGPIITMSMSGIGSISRLCGEVFGSALTFGAAGQTSAPGQMDVKDLAEGLALIHRGL